MAAELIELLRFDCKKLIGKSIQLYQTKFQGNCKLLVLSTTGKQIYVLTSNVLTHIILLKHDVQSCYVDADKKFHILTSLGQIFAVSLSNLASELTAVDLDQDPRITEVSHEHRIADFSNALAMLAFGKKIFVLCEAFGVFYLEIISDNCSEIKQSKEEQKSFQRRDAIRSHNNSGAVDSSTTVQTRLYILLPFSYKDYDSNDSTVGVLRVCDQLYNCLFGRLSNLMNSPILLVVRPGGMLHWLPLCGFQSESEVLDGTSGRSVVNGANVLCDLEQDVVGVFSCAVNDGKSTNRGKSLPPHSVMLFIGCQGSVLTINCESRNGILMPAFQRCVIPGPVVCCDVSAVVLFYSTGHDLLHVDLSELLADSRKCGVVQHLKTKSFSICNVVALSMCVKETADKSAETDLFVVTSTGCLSRLSLDLSSSLTRDAQDPSQTLSSQLIGIRQLSDEYRTLGKKSQMLDAALSQLALAGIVQSQGHQQCQGRYFMQRHNEQAQHRQQSTAQQSNEIVCPVCCLTNIQTSRSKLLVTVVLKNCSNFIFRNCWTFQVTVSKQHTSAKTGLTSPCLSSACCIDGLSTGDSASVTVELPCNFASPFLVSPSLILDLEGLLPSSTSLAPLVLPLPAELFDELRLLRPLSQYRNVLMGSRQNDLSKILLTIADQHSYASVLQKDRLLTSELQDYRFDICVPHQITQEIVQLDTSSVKAEKGNDCQMLLRYLIASNSFFNDVPFENETLQAVSSCGLLVTINVHLSGPANSGGGSVVSLQSSHTGLLAQLHHDITSRLKTLSCARATLPSSNDKLRKALLKEVEDLLLEFHDGSSSVASTLSKVPSLYRSIRSMRLW